MLMRVRPLSVPAHTSPWRSCITEKTVSAESPSVFVYAVKLPSRRRIRPRPSVPIHKLPVLSSNSVCNPRSAQSLFGCRSAQQVLPGAVNAVGIGGDPHVAVAVFEDVADVHAFGHAVRPPRFEFFAVAAEQSGAVAHHPQFAATVGEQAGDQMAFQAFGIGEIFHFSIFYAMQVAARGNPQRAVVIERKIAR